MIRIQHLAAVLGLAAIIIATHGETAPTEKAGNLQALQTLAKKIDAIEWDKVPLDKALIELADKISPGVTVDMHAIDAAKIDKTEPVTLSLRSVTAAEVLAFLPRLSSDFPMLECAVVDGKISIAPESVAQKNIFLRTYEVGDLIKLGRDKNENERLQLALMTNLASMAAPQSWATIGDIPWSGSGAAPYGAMKCAGTKISVTSTAGVHLEMTAVLELLRGKGPVFSQETAAKDPFCKKFDEFKWNDITLEKALDEVIKKTDQKVIVDWRSIEAEHSRDEQITLSARGATFEELFALMAFSMHWSQPLGVYKVGDTLVISSSGAADRQGFINALYEVDDLLDMHADRSVDSEKRLEGAATVMMEVIADSVECESWTTINDTPWVNSGPNPHNSMRNFGSKLIIRGSPQIHWKVSKFLGALRSRKGIAGLPEQWRRNIPQVLWKDVELIEAFKDLGNLAQMSVIPDWRTIESKQNLTHVPLTLVKQDANIVQMLAVISKSIQYQLGAYAFGDNVIVTSVENADKHGVALVYDVRDLVKPRTKATEESGEQVELPLMEKIARNVETESWARIGYAPWQGAGATAFGTLRYYNGRLIVMTPPRVQYKLAEYLEKLRRK